jgi:hypothetical protein
VLRDPGDETKYKIELSANTLTLISCKNRLIKVVAGTSRGKKGSKAGGLFPLSGTCYHFGQYTSTADESHRVG